MRAQLPCSLAGAVFIAASITLMAKQAAKYLRHSLVHQVPPPYREFQSSSLLRVPPPSHWFLPFMKEFPLLRVPLTESSPY